MVISASRRTDIPAFYGEWFFNRLLEKEVYVRNPMNYNQVSKINLSPDEIECIVFWTKNPSSFMKYINPIIEMGYNFYFQFTINPYDVTIETNVEKKESIINTFIMLSNSIGRNKVIWRYDPILINDKYDYEYHQKWFAYLCNRLSGHTQKCVISFLDEYKFIQNKLAINNVQTMDNELILRFAAMLSNIASKYNIELSSCSEGIDLSQFGISHNKCIDDALINSICGSNTIYSKDQSQRDECGCIQSKDIGVYSSCMHQCIYCYANKSNPIIKSKKYKVKSPMLCDELSGSEKIIEFKSKNVKTVGEYKLDF